MILYVQFLILIWFFTEAVVIDFRRGSVRGYSVVMNGIQANVFKVSMHPIIGLFACLGNPVC